MSFALHPDLQRDGIDLGHFPLCQILLINDDHYPWFVLVPRRAAISDTIDLSPQDYAQLWTESRLFSEGIMSAFSGEKLNVAALGNMTPQLHIHHIVRYASDPAWPGPIWGQHPLRPYSVDGIRGIRDKIHAAAMPGFEPAPKPRP